MRHDRIVAQNKERLRDAVRTSEESAQIGRESLVTMHDQGRQLERVNRTLDDVDRNLNRSERVLRSLTFWGRVRNFFTPDRTGRAWNNFERLNNSNANDDADDTTARESVAMGGAQSKRPIAGAADEEEEHLEEMLANSVGDLKQIALAMTMELDAHGALLNEATQKAERSRVRTKEQAHKTWLMM